MQNIGKAIAIMCAQKAMEHAMHADVDAWGAPSECHGLVARGEAQRIRLARRHAEAVAGAPLRRIYKEAERRIGANALRRAEERCTAQLINRYWPF